MNPSGCKQDVTQGQLFDCSLTGLNLVFLLLDELPYKDLKHSLPYDLPVAGRNICKFIPFLRVLAL